MYEINRQLKAHLAHPLLMPISDDLQCVGCARRACMNLPWFGKRCLTIIRHHSLANLWLHRSARNSSPSSGLDSINARYPSSRYPPYLGIGPGLSVRTSQRPL